MDFHFKIVWLDTKRNLNGNRMYILLHPNHFSKTSDFQQYAEFFLFFSIRKSVPVHAEKSYRILNFLLQTSITVSDNSIAMVVHNSNSIAMVLPAMSILSQ